jgi:hypothetical protein
MYGDIQCIFIESQPGGQKRKVSAAMSFLASVAD